MGSIGVSETVMTSPKTGRVVAIAVRTERNGPMREVESTRAHQDSGIEGDLPVEPDRGITLIAREQWEEVTGELGVELPWHTRRANLLVEGLQMADLMDQRVHVGEVELKITGETKPCGLMDQQHGGLREALGPDLRGGVHGRVVRGGEIAVGDVISIE